MSSSVRNAQQRIEIVWRMPDDGEDDEVEEKDAEDTNWRRAEKSSTKKGSRNESLESLRALICESIDFEP